MLSDVRNRTLDVLPTGGVVVTPTAEGGEGDQPECIGFITFRFADRRLSLQRYG